MIYLLRHGETSFNRQGRFQGRNDSALTEKGVAQAVAMGAALAALIGDDRAGWRIETSPLGRARQTAAIVAEALGLPEARVEPRLIEASYGALEGLTRPEVDARWPELVGVQGVFGYAPDGEPLAELDARARAWLGDRDGRRTIAVAHASIGRAIRGAYVGAAFEQYRLFETPQDAFHVLRQGRIERIDCSLAALARGGPRR